MVAGIGIGIPMEGKPILCIIQGIMEGRRWQWEKRGETTWENFCNYNKIFTNNLQLFVLGEVGPTTAMEAG